MPAGSTFEADLRAHREANGLSLSDIQQQTRIPVDVLRRFEDGDLIGDPTYNEVYLKAFLQSYAKAVGASAGEVVTAYSAVKAGTYAGELHPDHDVAPAASTRSETAPEPGASRPPAAPERAEPPAAEPPAAEPPAEEPPASTGTPAAVEALRRAPDPTKTTPSAPKPQTLAQARVNRPAVPTAKHSFDKNWGAILGLFGIVVVALGLAFYFLIFAGDDEPDDPDTVAVSGDAEEEPEEVAVDSAGVGAGAAAGGPRFQTPITVTLTAGGDGLQSFRVTEDDGDRRPYWIEVGDSETFEADSSLILWGEDPSFDFSEATVEIQGLRFTPQSGNALRIDAQTGQRLLDSLAAVQPAPGSAAGAAPPPVDPDAVE